MEKGCHYVDVNKNEWLSDQERASTSNYMLHNAGSLPGISGLLPSYAAGCFDTADSVELYYMASGEFSNTAANDYVQGGTTKGMVKYQDGTCVPAFLDAGNAYMPVFNREFKVFPYLDAEAMHCIETMKLVRGSWFMAYEKGYTLAILEKINCASYVNDTKIAEKVCTASKLDCKVNGQYAGIIIQAEGYQGGEKRVKTLIIKYDSPALFTGSAVAAAIISVLERKIESGIYMLSETFKGQQIIDVLKEIATYSTFVMEDGKLDEALAEKEGEL